MRALLVLVALAGTARADGAYMLGEIGATTMHGGMLDGHGAVRLRLGGGATFDLWDVELWGSADTLAMFDIDGCEPGCAPATPWVGLITIGADVRRDLPLIYARPPRSLQWFRPRLQAFVHGGIRSVHGDDSIGGYSGAGIGGGVGFEVAVRIFTAYVDFGLDRFRLSAPQSAPIDGETFHVVLGERIGFSL